MMGKLKLSRSIAKLATSVVILFGVHTQAYAVEWPPLTDRARAKLVADQYPIDVYDPLEGVNRRVYIFNAKFDRYLLLPVTDLYTTVTPSFLRDRVRSFLGNLGELRNFTNSTLQLKPRAAMTALGRFATNTTVGIGGTFDVATKVGFEEAPEDFGQTLASYGVAEGAYLVLPALGPSNLRDVSGMAFDAAVFNLIDPLNFSNFSERQWMYGSAKGLTSRADNAFRYHTTGSPFEYEIVRFIYTAKRKLEAGK
ncbi:MAG: VacJ family lipoprotein [Halopseudomonas aestusnigri]